MTTRHQEGQKHETWKLSLGVLGLTAGLLMAAFPEALTGKFFFALDLHQTFQPLRAILSDALRHSTIGWNSLIGNGLPVFGNPLQAAAYPPNLVFTVLSPERGLTLLTFAHLLLATFGAWSLARQWRLGTYSAWMAGWIYGFNGVAVAATAFPNLSWSAAWLPWFALTWQRTTSPERQPRDTVALVAVVAMMLSIGEPFSLLAGALLVAMVSLAMWTERPRSPLRGPTMTTFAATVAGIALASPFLVAVARYLPHSFRGLGLRPEGVMYWSLHPTMSLGLILPTPFADPEQPGLYSYWAHALVPEKGFSLFSGFYVGGIAIALVAVALLLGSDRRRWFLLALLAVFAALAVGSHGPLYPLLAEMPLFNGLRFPVKWALPAMLPFALLAGIGADAMFRRLKTSRPDSRSVAVFASTLGLLAAVVVATLLAGNGWLDSLVTSEGTTVDAGLRHTLRLHLVNQCLRAAAPVLAVLILLLVAPRLKGNRVAAALAALLTLDLLLVNRDLAPLTNSEPYQTPPPAVEIVHKDPAGHGRLWSQRPPAAETDLVKKLKAQEACLWERKLLLGYTAASWGIATSFNADTPMLAPLPYTRLRVIVESAPVRERLMLLGASGVTHLVTFERLEGRNVQMLAALQSLGSRPQLVYRNRLAQPRARVVSSLLPYTDDQGFIAVLSRAPDNLFAHVALVENSEIENAGISVAELGPVNQGGVGGNGVANIIEDSGDELRIQTFGHGGFLIVSDCYVPGWRATVDGRPAPILRADLAFRAVPIPAGVHEVTMRYRWW